MQRPVTVDNYVQNTVLPHKRCVRRIVCSSIVKSYLTSRLSRTQRLTRTQNTHNKEVHCNDSRGCTGQWERYNPDVLEKLTVKTYKLFDCSFGQLPS